MRDEQIQRLENGLLSDGGIVTATRFGRPFSDVLVDEVCTILEELALQYVNENLVPKRLASLLFDVPTALMSDSSRYSGQERDRIMQVADRISDRIRSIYC